MPRAKLWQISEDSFIASSWNNQTDREMAAVLGRSEQAVTSHRAELRLLRADKGEKGTGVKPWSIQDDDTIREMFRNEIADEDMAIALGRTIGAVAQRRSSLRLLRKPRPRQLPGYVWTDEQDLVLSFLFRIGKTDEEIGHAMDKTATAIKDRRQTVGLWRTPRR